ncbi:hypothetical protein J7K05_01060 [bacterium]|nr:hypothetical protein [bacterium]
MEIKLFLQIIKRQLWWLLVPLIVIPIATTIFSFQQKPRYTAYFSFSAIPVSQTEGSSSYETMRSATIFVNTIRNWLYEEAIVAEILKEANINPENTQINLKSLYKVPQLDNTFSLPVQLSADSREQAEKIALATIKIINQETEKFNQTSKTGLSFAVESSEPYIVETKPNLKYNLALGLVSGVLLGLFLALSKHYIET